MQNQKVLVTGGAGYVGSVLVGILLQKGFAVRVIDNLSFGAESLLGVWNHPRFEFIKGDIRHEADLKNALEGIDSVCHLAAIVGEPPSKKYPKETYEINWEASVKLYQQCEKARIKRFVFASTCSNYGQMPDPNLYVNEESPLNPISLYAETKVNFEQYLLQQKNTDICKTILRFATVYGISPRIRFDLTVNEFTRDATLGKEVVIFGENFWRPYCHVYDLANAMSMVLEADPKIVANECFNVGNTTENYTKKMLMDEIQKFVPSLQVTYKQMGADPRDYRVNCDKIRDVLGFQITQTVPSGIAQIHQIVKYGVLLNPEEQRFVNV
jgi:nucleoside-diphosphate-sugar epimerase